MARVILDRDDDVVVGSDARIFGTVGGSETVRILAGNITFDASFNAGGDTIILAGPSTDYSGRVVGSTMVITNGELTVRIPIGVEGLDVVFEDRTLELRYDVESDTVLLGDQDFGRDDEPVGTGGGNEAPVVERDIPNQVLEEEEAWSYTIPRSTFSDPDGDRLTYTATLSNGGALPAWIDFNPVTRTFSGTPPQDYSGTIRIEVSASDGEDSASETFRIDIQPVNDAPRVAAEIADQDADEDAPWSFIVPAGTFVDDDGDGLTYGATLAGGGPLPAWLSFDADSCTFSGTPPQDYTGEIEITVTASDGSGSASDTFTVTVEGVNDAPSVAFEMPAGLPTIAAGPETQVNTTTFDSQTAPSVVALADGSYVVAWQSWGQDGDSQGVYTQLYDGSGNPVGGETLVNTTIEGSQSQASIAPLAGGGYVVTWMSVDTDSFTSDIHAQRYDASGAPVGGETLINTHTEGDQTSQSAAMLADGGYVVAWMSLDQDGDAYGIYAQRFDASGGPAGPETLVNSTTENWQQYPSVAGLAGGGFVVTWMTDGQDGSSYGVYAQRYDEAGAPLGGETRVNSYTASSQTGPSVAALTDGGYVVAWVSTGQDGAGDGIYFQLYDEAGAPVGVETRANTYTDDGQFSPSVTSLADGGFVVTWTSTGQDGDGFGIYAQRYDASGDPVDGETLVNTHVAGYQGFPSVAGLPDGGYVVTWQSPGQDDSGAPFGYGIYSQRFVPGLAATEQVSLDLAGMILVDDADASGDLVVTLSVDDGELIVGAGTTGADVSGSGADEVTITGTLAEIQALLAGEDGASLSFTANTDEPPEEAELTVTIDDGFDVTIGSLDIAIMGVPDI